MRQATLRHFNLLSLLCISAFLWLLFVTVMSAGERWRSGERGTAELR